MIAGISGHQNIKAPEQTAWVRRSLEHLVSIHRVHLGLSSLATGADQLFAEAILAAGCDFDAVIPCQDYERTFIEEVARARFRELLSSAARTHVLSYPCPSEEAFFAAGNWIVSRCEILFAVWNGLSSRGLGGTGDVVKVAELVHRQWIHLDPVKQAITPHLDPSAT